MPSVFTIHSTPPPSMPACLPATDIVNWVYRYFTERHYKQWIVWISGLIQVRQGGEPCGRQVACVPTAAAGAAVAAAAAAVISCGSSSCMQGRSRCSLPARCTHHAAAATHLSFPQTAIYADFFYFYTIAWKSNKRLQLPA